MNRRDARAVNAARAAEVSARRSAVRAQVIAAWRAAEPSAADHGLPGAIPPHCARPDCPAIAAYFSQRRWDDLSLQGLRAGCGASSDGPLPFLPAPAQAYFLGGLLLLHLARKGNELDVLGEAIVHAVCPHMGWRDKVAWLSTAQQDAVVAFLELQRDEGSSDPAVAEGLAFWAARRKA